MCQPIVMMLVLPFQAELTSTIGPGSRNRRIFDTGKSFFVKALIALSGSAAAALAQSETVKPHGRDHACAATLPANSSLSLDHRRRSRTPRTAILTAFF